LPGGEVHVNGGREMQKALDALTGLRGVLGGLLATEDGFPVAARLHAGHDTEAMAAAASAMGRIAVSTLGNLDRGDLEVAAFEATRLTFLVRRLSVGFLLAITEPEANLGFIAAEMSRTAATLEQAAALLSPA